MPLAASLPLVPPSGGWVRTVRESLGMSLAAFAKRLNLASPSTAHQIETAEVTGTISIHRLRAAADALGCDLAVVLIPRQPLTQLVQDRARKVAAARMRRVSHSMEMEDQGVADPQFEAMVHEAAGELVRRAGARLWDEV